MRVSALWYAVAVGPLLVAVALVAARSVGGAPRPETAEWTEIKGLPDAGVVGTAILLLVLNGVGEELGRGCAVEHAGLLVAGP